MKRGNTFKLLLTLFLSALSPACFAQNDCQEHMPGNSINLKTAYNSSLIYPGARFGVEFPVKTFGSGMLNVSLEKKEKVKESFITANLSWYHHPYFHDNLYLTAGWTIRKTKPTGFFTEFSPEIGVSRTFIGGTTYKVDEAGNVSREKFAGYFYPLISVGGGLGYDFSIIKLKPLMLFYKMNLITMYPYNSTVYLRPAMELGVIYKLKGNHLSKTRQKNQ